MLSGYFKRSDLCYLDDDCYEFAGSLLYTYPLLYIFL